MPEVDAIISALKAQRNAALDEIARMAGIIAVLQAKVRELERS